MLRFKAEYDAATAATARGDAQAATDHYLAAVINFHEKERSVRFASGSHSPRKIQADRTKHLSPRGTLSKQGRRAGSLPS
jgi:hypothetical protein